MISSWVFILLNILNMKIAFISDIHTEFYDRGNYILTDIDQLPDPDDGDILVIAGDFGYFQHGKYNVAARYLLNKYKNIYDNIYIVPGNHEYYTGSYQGIPRGINPVEEYDNVFVIKDDKVNLSDDTALYGTTLFSSLDVNLRINSYRLNDFNYIRYNHHLLNPDDMDKIHNDNIKGLKQFIDTDTTDIKIVVSHFPPVPEIRDINSVKYNNGLDSYFYNDILKEVDNIDSIDYWIYGHNHLNPVKELTINGCKFVCNQIGYKHEYTYSNHIKSIDI